MALKIPKKKTHTNAAGLTPEEEFDSGWTTSVAPKGKSTAAEQKRWRIQVAVWACAYEIADASLVDDFKFDQTCLKIDTSISTDNPELDEWFRNNFDPSTGQWIHDHPHLERIAEIVGGLIEYYERNEIPH